MEDVIPFYGASDRETFAIERAAMDQRGAVLEVLDELLPDRGRVLDMGAGDGFTARALARGARQLVALEPAEGMIDRDAPLVWVRGSAEALPFHDASFAAAYSTWAYFFPPFNDPVAGLDELRRVVSPGGLIAIVGNAGGDPFCAMAPNDISVDASWFTRHGFEERIVETSFDFESNEDARRLLGFYFGERGEAFEGTSVAYRVGVWTYRVPGE